MIEENVTAAMLLFHSIIYKIPIDHYLEFALVLAQWYHMVPQLPIKMLHIHKIHMIAIQCFLMLLDSSVTILKQLETFDYFVENFQIPQQYRELNYLHARRSHFGNSDTTFPELLWKLMQLIWVTSGIISV